MSRVFLLFIGATLTASLLAQEGQGPPLRVDFTGPYPDIPEQTAPMQTIGPLRVDFAGPYPDVQDPAAMAAPETGPLRVDFTGAYPDLQQAAGGPQGGPQVAGPPPAGSSPSDTNTPPGGPQTTSGPPAPSPPSGDAGGPQQPGAPPPPQRTRSPAPPPGVTTRPDSAPRRGTVPSRPSPQPTNLRPVSSPAPGNVVAPRTAQTNPAPAARIVMSDVEVTGSCVRAGRPLKLTGSGFGRSRSAQVRIKQVRQSDSIPLRALRWSDTEIWVEVSTDRRIVRDEQTAYHLIMTDPRGRQLAKSRKQFVICR